ncbi:MAG TPA: hypothetical protein VNW97_22555 [Candidatus Saccharimonadales bacterium]|jgi:hypothetical protein|nr:hypothetical protein [Candidatus Saccharimonadales bacterium]
MKNILMAAALLTGLVATGFGQAQEERREDKDNKEHSLPCRQERLVIKGHGPTGKANLDHSDFPSSFTPAEFAVLDNPATNMFNQTAINQHFAYTFRFPGWPSANGKECCRCIDGATVTITFKALQGGPPKSPTSANDVVTILSSLAPGPGHVVANQDIWPNGATTGQTETLTFKVPCKFLSNGHLSFFVQDDTAVLSAELSLSSCCLEGERK